MYSIVGKLAIIHSKDLKRIIIAGDIHGDADSFYSIEKLFSYEDLLIFLGDYGDRGLNSFKVIDNMEKLIQKYSDRVIALKGNHEDYSKAGEPQFYPCTLKEEIEFKNRDWLSYFSELKKNFLDRLFLAAIIPGRILFVHGGISTKITSRENLIYPSREIEKDVIWSDPIKEGEYPNPRGAGVLFGSKISEKVARNLNIRYIVRSHEPAKAFTGLSSDHNGKVVTINSTRVYGGKPFVLILSKDDVLKRDIEMKKNQFFL